MAGKKGSRQAQLKRERAQDVHAQNQRAAENNARVTNEANAAAEQQRVKAQQADNEVPQENDMVTIDSQGVPEALHTAPMVEALRGLNTAGMHGRSGRLVRFEEGPAGRMGVVEGADFTQQVPAAALVRADVFHRQRQPKKAAKKKSAAKKSPAKRKRSK